LQFRNQQYPGYIDLLPVSGKDGLAVLDYGCGPGHDLVGFAHYSRPKRLVGIDISPSSLAEAEERLKLHHVQAELVRVDYGAYDLPFDAASFDYIHCSGVLMCIEQPARLLREFHRLLKPTGELRLMVYNYDSIWLHLYVAYVVQIENGLYSDLPPEVAFTRTTDGEDCPVNAIWRPEEMLALGRDAGFDPEFLGAAVSLWELHLLPRRHIACLQPALPRESRTFLMGLRIDAQGHPWHGEHRAGIDGCFRLVRSN
jgi:SAM-dependent methyltransferase